MAGAGAVSWVPGAGAGAAGCACGEPWWCWVPGAGAGAGAVSWLHAWWRVPVLGAGARF